MMKDCPQKALLYVAENQKVENRVLNFLVKLVEGFNGVEESLIRVAILQAESQPLLPCLCPAMKTWKDGASTTPVVSAGLCNVSRNIIFYAMETFPDKNAEAKKSSEGLLGFRQGCLKACSEVSHWTKFCEKDLPSAVTSFQADINAKLILHQAAQTSSSFSVKLPAAITRIENDFTKPKKVFNRRKQKTKVQSGVVLPSDFLCGDDMTVADIIVFVQMHSVFVLIWSDVTVEKLRREIPLTMAWWDRMTLTPAITNVMSRCSMAVLPNAGISKGDPQLIVDIEPCCTEISEFNKNSRLKRIRTDMQHRLATVLETCSDAKLNPATVSLSPLCAEIQWKSLDPAVDPASGELNAERALRKQQQISSIVGVVNAIAREGDTIVDFCSGGGHLGLVIANSFPNCKVVLVENKEESLKRARHRARTLQLQNITFCHCNLNYFCADFNVGVALHACGTATDLVLDMCLKRKASFVVSPCCYGSIHPSINVPYPRSICFRAHLEEADQVILGHGADRTNWDFTSDRATGGKECMNLVDADRLQYAVEQSGYTTYLSSLNPPTCSPKNNLICGMYSDHPLKTAVFSS